MRDKFCVKKHRIKQKPDFKKTENHIHMFIDLCCISNYFQNRLKGDSYVNKSKNYP